VLICMLGGAGEVFLLAVGLDPTGEGVEKHMPPPLRSTQVDSYPSFIHKNILFAKNDPRL